MDKPILLTGVIHGKTITLDEPVSLPDGARVTLQLVEGPAVPPARGDEVARAIGLEPDETLAAIYRMRHTGRSIQSRR